MRILIAYDESECSRAALADLKRAGLPRNVDAHVLSVCADWMPASTTYSMVKTNFTKYLPELEKSGLAMSRRACAVLKSTFPDWEIHAEPATGSPAGWILQRAEELKTDLIVVGSHGRSTFGRLMLGSVSQKVLHAAQTSVRVAREREKPSTGPVRIILGVDGSKDSAKAVNAVAARCWPKRSEARVVNSFPVHLIRAEYATTQIARWVDDDRKRVSQAIETAIGKLKAAGLAVSRVVKEEDARKALVGETKAWGADCIFVGARGMSSAERFLLGSVSSYVATHAPCSVEVVRRWE